MPYLELTSPPRRAVAATGWADLLELECLRRSDRNASADDLCGWMRRDVQADDTIGRKYRRPVDEAGENSDEDLLDQPDEPEWSSPAYVSAVGAVMGELQDRSRHSGSGWHAYPFELSDDGLLLSSRDLTTEPRRAALYLFLLLATRLNMGSHASQGGVDGTALFERLCALVAKTYWGGERAESMVFGTAREASRNGNAGFRAALADMCQRTGEGAGVRTRDGYRWNARDGKLDIVVWRAFADERCGKAWAYGQCKTGSSWGDNELTQLDPQAFNGSWLALQPPVPPARLFFAAERCGGRDERCWEDLARRGGIVFDRCRILDWCPEITGSVWDDLLRWLDAALVAAELRWP